MFLLGQGSASAERSAKGGDVFSTVRSSQQPANTKKVSFSGQFGNNSVQESVYGTSAHSNNMFSTGTNSVASISINNEYVGDSSISAYIHSHRYSGSEFLDNLDVPDIADGKVPTAAGKAADIAIANRFSDNCNIVDP